MEKIKDQLYASGVHEINAKRTSDELLKLAQQDNSFNTAVGQLDAVRDFVSKPNNILGSDATKHGEIAEQVEVGIRNARQVLKGEDMTSTFDNVGRTAPEDYLIDGIAVQSKFINGYVRNLDHVINHMEKYPNFGRDGSYYHIPKDTYEEISTILKGGSVDGLKLKTLNSIKQKIELIETSGGKSFDEIVKPSQSNYKDVFQNKVDDTLNSHQEDLKSENKKIKQDIKQDHKPSVAEGLKVAGVAAAVGGAVTLTSIFYKKYKEGKKFYKGDFTNEDWKETGLETLKGSVIGGVSGYSIYTLTNYAGISAPFAGAVVSATRGVVSLLDDYNNEKVSKEELTELGLIICSEAAIVGITTAVGQTIIPIPVIGALIGSVAGSMLNNIVGSKNAKTAYKIKIEIKLYLEKIEKKYQEDLNKLIKKYEDLGDLMDAAFDISNNEKLLMASVELARYHNVDEKRILKSIDEVDIFINE